MKSSALIFCFLIFPFGSAGASEQAKLAAQANLPPYSRHFDPQRDPFADGHAAIELARQTGRHILIELGGDWCRWCHVMDDFFARNADLKAELHDTFVMLKVNVSDANDNATFLAAFPKPLGYPHMYIANSDGQLLESKDTAEFLQHGNYSRQRFQAFFKKWQTPAQPLTTGTTP